MTYVSYLSVTVCGVVVCAARGDDHALRAAPPCAERRRAAGLAPSADSRVAARPGPRTGSPEIR